MLGGGNLGGAHGDAIVGYFDGDVAGLAAGGIKNVEFAIQFVDDLTFVVGAGPTNVPFGAVGQLIGFLGGRIEGKEIVGAVAIRREENFGADPHGVAVGARVVGDFLLGMRLQIKNIELLCPAAGVALPGAEIAEERRVHGFGAIGRKIAGAGLGHGKSFRHAAGSGNGVKAAVTKIEIFAAGTEDYGLAVGRPSIDLIVVTPTRRERSTRGIEGELLWNAARDGNDVNLFVPVVLSGKGDPLAVGRELGEEFEARVRGEARGQSTRR